MAERPGVFSLTSLALVGLALSGSAGHCVPENSAQTLSQVWAREDDYLRFRDGSHPKEYLALFDERFRGWSCGVPHPENKAEIQARLPTLAKLAQSSTRDREGETIVDRLVTVFYRLHSPGPNGTNVTRDLTHTWVHDGDVWKIISGMCKFEQ